MHTNRDALTLQPIREIGPKRTFKVHAGPPFTIRRDETGALQGLPPLEEVLKRADVTPGKAFAWIQAPWLYAGLCPVTQLPDGRIKTFDGRFGDQRIHDDLETAVQAAFNSPRRAADCRPEKAALTRNAPGNPRGQAAGAKKPRPHHEAGLPF